MIKSPIEHTGYHLSLKEKEARRGEGGWKGEDEVQLECEGLFVVVMGLFMFDCLFVLDSQPANER